MTNLLILGGSGILGSSLIAECKLNNIPFDAPSSSSLDIRRQDQILDYFSLHQPSAIVNCAAWTDVENSEIQFEKAQALNSEAIKYLAVATKQADIPFIHLSTDYVFDGTKEGQYSENDPTSPINRYGVSKLQGEKNLLEIFPEKAYIIRTSWLYGTSGRNFVKTILKKALDRDHIQVVNDQLGSPTNSEDLAQGILGIFNKRPQEGIYNYCNKGQITWYEFALKIYELAGADVGLVEPIHSKLHSGKVKRPSRSVLSVDKWNKSGITDLVSWDASLSRIFPRILDAINKEIS